jgi:hypothetical protein
MVPYVQTLMDVRADRVTLLGGGGRGAGIDRGDSVGHSAPVSSEASEPLTDDDIPF